MRLRAPSEPVSALFPLVLLGAAVGCKPNIALPDQNKNDNQDPPAVDTAPPDEEDSGEPLPPPPTCPFTEVEPNNGLTEAYAITPEAWACGTLLDDGEDRGVDFLTLEVPQDGWFSMWTRGESVGAFGDIDMAVFVNYEDGGSLVPFEDRPGSTDAYAALPLTAGDTLHVSISDYYNGAGEAYPWAFLASTLKEAPLTWTATEEGDVAGSPGANDTLAGALQTLTHGDRLWGVLGNSRNDLADNYFLSVPAGRSTVRVEVQAWRYGSPLNAKLSLLDPGGNVKRSRSYEGDSWDPIVEYTITVDEAQTWSLELVKANDYFGPYHWYVLDVSVVLEEEEAG
jgi:hypothetical protein